MNKSIIWLFVIAVALIAMVSFSGCAVVPHSLDGDAHQQKLETFGGNGSDSRSKSSSSYSY